VIWRWPRSAVARQSLSVIGLKANSAELSADVTLVSRFDLERARCDSAPTLCVRGAFALPALAQQTAGLSAQKIWGRSTPTIADDCASI